MWGDEGQGTALRFTNFVLQRNWLMLESGEQQPGMLSILEVCFTASILTRRMSLVCRWLPVTTLLPATGAVRRFVRYLPLRRNRADNDRTATLSTPISLQSATWLRET